MFQIKICGITNVDDARAVVRAGADAVGLNFYARSSRFVTPETAGQIAATLPAHVVKVGLFIDTPAEEVCRQFDDLPLDLIQLHGDQPPEFLARLGRRPVMRAFRVGANGLQPIVEYLAQCRAMSVSLTMVLMDTLVEGKYGGTGQVADWAAAQQYTAIPDAPPLVLAGGLTPGNVATAIQAVAPAAVDVASGVESSPGQKDAAAVEAFVQAARAAFHQR